MNIWAGEVLVVGGGGGGVGFGGEGGTALNNLSDNQNQVEEIYN